MRLLHGTACILMPNTMKIIAFAEWADLIGKWSSFTPSLSCQLYQGRCLVTEVVSSFVDYERLAETHAQCHFLPNFSDF